MTVVTDSREIEEIILSAKKKDHSLWRWSELIRNDKRVHSILNANRVQPVWGFPIRPGNLYVGASPTSVNIYQCRGLDAAGHVYSKHSSIVFDFNQCVLIVKPGTVISEKPKSITTTSKTVLLDIAKEENTETQLPENLATPEQIASLPEMLQRVVLLYLQGSSRKEVATVLGLPVSSVKHYIAHARSLLKRY